MEIDKSVTSNENLTSAEIGKLWSTYMGNSMATRVLQFYLQHVEDPDIQNVLEFALQISESFIQKITEIYRKKNHPIPVGFTEDDVNLQAPRLFLDEFYLHYLKYTAKAGMSLYGTAVPLMTRDDTRELFTYCIKETVELMNRVNKVLQAKGFIQTPPYIPVPNHVDFVKKQHYLNGVIGNVRPPHALEITHLHDNIENNVTSKALLVGFSQVVRDEKARNILVRGKELTERHIFAFSEVLQKHHLPAPPRLEHLVTTSIQPPFSDKLMLFHKIDMFSMKIRGYGNAISLNGRHDIGFLSARLLLDVSVYVEDLGKLMIEKGWLEQMPEAPDRDSLANK
ncbi:MAG TPA: DUF3231 family protein [Bacillus sp. (in: firmicutes)]|uniref:DUF3231 family protein n=1 Tax=Bacillus litorisediminis TaxID=2922713 RepID=UPI001FAE85E2|nr:DUF3231 family protein [Bacillus litorisediminis]HWO76724.1 DUF3231 family protein [Bacillus sp. (in: firmicutes)]